MKISAILLAAWCVPALLAADPIAAGDAKSHVGESATVCGKVVGTRYLDSSNRRPTFLNFDKPYPNHPFLAIIFGENRAKFGNPEKDFLEKDICVTGKIVEYNGKPEMELTDPKQVQPAAK